MTEIRVGDKVRVTNEGVVEETDLLRRHVVLAGGRKVPIGEVEVLEQAPFSTATTIRLGRGSHSFKTKEGWVWGGGHPASHTDAEIRRWLASGDAEIVYAPPA